MDSPCPPFARGQRPRHATCLAFAWEAHPPPAWPLQPVRCPVLAECLRTINALEHWPVTSVLPWLCGHAGAAAQLPAVERKHPLPLGPLGRIQGWVW